MTTSLRNGGNDQNSTRSTVASPESKDFSTEQKLLSLSEYKCHKIRRDR